MVGPAFLPLPWDAGVPQAPSLSDEVVLSSFVADEPAGLSAMFHVEDSVLMADGDIPAAIRLDTRAVLVRTDLPEAWSGARPRIEEALERGGLARLDEDTVLALPVALQVVGLRLSSWDLWGHDIDEAFDALRAAAAGDGRASVASLMKWGT